MKKTIILLSLFFILPTVTHAANLSNNLIFYSSYMNAEEWSYYCINETGKSFDACLNLYYNYARPMSLRMQQQAAKEMEKRQEARLKAELSEQQQLRKVAIEKERKEEQRMTYLINMLNQKFEEGN